MCTLKSVKGLTQALQKLCVVVMDAAFANDIHFNSITVVIFL
jgi:hypothetical protein